MNSDNVSPPFICELCGRLFCDSDSLMRHIIIHQDKEKVLEEIKGLGNSEFTDGSRAQVAHCVFVC